MRLAALLVITATSLAHAQPTDPYAPPTPAPGADDPVLAEQIAQAIMFRAQQLYDAKMYVDARQLALEALAKSPKGSAAEHAKYLLAAVAQQLAPAEPPKPPEDLDAQVDKTPIVPPPDLQGPPVAEQPAPEARVLAARVHGGIYLGIVGAAVGSLFSEDTPAAGAVPLGLAGAAGGALLAPKLLRDRGSEAQIRTAGSGSVWGGVIGSFFGDAVSVDGTTARGVLGGAAIGSTLGLLGGYAMSRKDQYTRGDVALVDTLAGIGAVGGLTMGMLMQPAEGEAYSVNAIIGTAGGVIVGLVAAPQTNTTPKRMMRVAGVAAIGGAAPFLLYAAIRDNSSNGDERLTGALSSIGLVGGLILGFRLTRHIDEGLDTKDGKRAPVDDAPAGVVGRHSDGRWSLGALAVQPLSLELAPQPGLAVPVLGGAW